MQKYFELPWKAIIILDACRYDYFKKVYRDYFNSDSIVSFTNITSPARDTREWIHYNFDGKYLDDVVYISANPFINSKGITSKNRTFDARKHFYKVIDAWKTGWDDELGTVAPSEVNKQVAIAKDIYKDKRFIIHYVQPHEPYISLGHSFKGNVHKTFGFYADRKTKINNLLLKFMSHETLWRLLKTFPIVKSEWGMRKQWELYDREGLQEGYELNLRWVMKYAKEVVNMFNGIKIITADHGELLGEGGYYGHHPQYPERLQKIVRQIPLLVVR